MWGLLVKAKIGCFKYYFGPYQLARLIRIPEKYEDDFVSYLDKIKVSKFLDWVYTKRKRKVKVKVDSWDWYSADTTIALITVPLLKELREHKQSYGFIDVEDAPDRFKPDEEVNKNSFDWDSKASDRYAWFLDEIIWALSQSIEEDDFSIESPSYHEDICEYEKRLSHGLYLFGKYFRTLWD